MRKRERLSKRAGLTREPPPRKRARLVSEAGSYVSRHPVRDQGSHVSPHPLHSRVNSLVAGHNHRSQAFGRSKWIQIFRVHQLSNNGCSMVFYRGVIFDYMVNNQRRGAMWRYSRPTN